MKSSASMETVKVSKQNEALSESQKRSQESVRNNQYEVGKYLFIPMSHFCVDARYNNRDFLSKRVLIFKLNDEKTEVQYVRTWKISFFTEMLAATKEEGRPEIEPVENQNGLLRIPAGELSYTQSCTDRIPKSVNEKGYLHIDAPFIIDYTGTLSGYVARYTERGDSNTYDVSVDPETGKVIFDYTNITQFSVLSDAVSEDLVNQAKDVLKSDVQLKSVKVD